MEIFDYKAGDEDQIVDLFKTVFKKQMSLDYWRWRFLNNPVQKVMIKLMWDKGQIVSHYAISPINIKSDEKEVLGGLSMTTMTHPGYLGLGLFTQLAESLYQDEFLKNNLAAVWGFPNNNSHYGFIKNLKWSDLEQIPTFKISSSNIKRKAVETISTFNVFQDNHIHAYNITTKNFQNKVLKNKDYFTWRYINNPINSYQFFEYQKDEVLFFAITKLYHNPVKNTSEVDIVELAFPSDRTALLELLNAITSFYSSQNVIDINIWVPINDPKHILMESLGFTNNTPITYSGIRIIDQSLNKLCDPKSWYYCMGDSDIY